MSAKRHGNPPVSNDHSTLIGLSLQKLDEEKISHWRRVFGTLGVSAPRPTPRRFGAFAGLLLSFFSVGVSQAQSALSGEQVIPPLGLGVALGLELFKERLVIPPRWTVPTSWEMSVRDQLVAPPESRELVSQISDGMYVGGLLGQYAWTRSERGAEAGGTVLRAWAVDVGVHTLVKSWVARERPYAHFHTRESRGADDNRSFYSGHTSGQFALAVSSARLVSEGRSDSQKAFIWGSSLLWAAGTGVLRVVADRHWSLDLLVGALAGSATGWCWTEYEMRQH